MGARGPKPYPTEAESIEGLGVSKAYFLMHGPMCGPEEDIGGRFAAYQTERAARKDWKTYRSVLMALEERTRRPWAFWEYEMDMKRPSPVEEQWKAIRDLGLARDKAEAEEINALLADAEERRLLYEKAKREGYLKTSS